MRNRGAIVGIVIIFIFLMIVAIFENENVNALTEEQEMYHIRRDAFASASRCVGDKKNNMQFADITWIVVEGEVIKYRATDGIAYLNGYYSINDSTIYIAHPQRKNYNLMKHESLHALGYIGHGYFPFHTCGVIPN